MTCKSKTLISIEDAYMRRLIDTTGISTVQARDLVAILGCDLSSLIREARLLMRKPGARAAIQALTGRVPPQAHHGRGETNETLRPGSGNTPDTGTA